MVEETWVVEQVRDVSEEGGIRFLKLGGDFKGRERVIIDSIISLYDMQHKDYSLLLAKIRESVSEQIESATKNKLRNHVFNPILKEATKDVRQKATEEGT